MDRLVFAPRVEGESGRPPLRDVFVPLGEVDEDEGYQEEGYEGEGYESELEDLAEATQLELQDEQGARYEGQLGTAVASGRLVVDRLPLLRRHAGTPPDLLIKWNAMTPPTQLDVVVHLHGFSGRGRGMRLLRDKEPISGLDFADPADPASMGRTAPALLVLPRGHFYGGRSGMGYTFPALERPGALDELIQDALARFAKATGVQAALGRRIVTAHSGGGASLMAILRHTDPDEVHTFDALYNNPKPLIEWAGRRAQRGEGALRVLYRRGEGTARNSERVHQALCPLLTPETRSRFRVDRTSVRHLDIPARYGWRLLQDPAAQLPDTSSVACPGGARQVRQGELLAEPGWPSQDGHEQEEAYSDQHERYPGEPELLEPGLEQLEAEYDEYEEALQEHEDYQDYEDDEEVSELEAMHPSGLEGETFPSGAVLSPTTGPVGEREEYWDPNGVGLPLYDTGPATHALKLSPNFTVGELVTSGGRRADKARISAGLVHCLQAIRDRVGGPVRVTSGYRSWARNEATYKQRGKEPTMSRHCSGQAADITVRGMTGMEIAKAALDACGDNIGIGIGATFAHVDVRGLWARWTYLSGAAARAALTEIDTYRRDRKSSPAPANAPATPVPPAPVDPRPVPGTAGATPERRAGRVRLGRFERCSEGPQPGANAMAAQWTRLTGRKAGCHNCRRLGNNPKRGWSLHGEGRAIDLYARADRPDQRAQAEAYIAWLLANAVELQVAVVIWNRRIWSWLYRARGWRPYKDGAHIDHVHVDLSWEGALHPSPLLDGPVPGMDGQPASSSPPPAPAPAPNGLAPEDVRAFVEQYGEPAVRGQELTGVPPLVTLGQAALESGWGTNAPGNNLFGGQGRDFQSAAEAFVAHGRLLRATRRYAGAFLHADDPHAFAGALAAAGYASSPDYGEQLTAVMRLLEDAAPNLDRPVPAATELEAEETAWLPEVERQAPPDPRCPDVVVPPSKRPAVLKRQSVHPAVREAQRKLNALHLYLVGTGLPGLRGAPLVEDCAVGTHTVDAVRSFQELVFPGEPKEHDGEIGPGTWTQLDAIALGPATPPVAQVTVDQVVVTDDAFAGALSWDQVVGLDTRQVNIEIVASGLPVAAMPDRVAVSLLSRLPNHAAGPGTLSSAISWDLTRAGTDPSDANRVRYRVSRPLTDAGAYLAVETRLKEVATVARIGGTSDAEFRRALRWAPRGQAIQPGVATTSTGSATGEIPDARTLFRTGGCEVLDVRVAARPNWKVPGPVARLIRNPADVFYYSGHGRSASGKLAVDTGTSPASCPSSGPFADWLGPGDLTSVWRSPMDTDVLILAGCSVLHVDFGTSPPTGPGIAWTSLLKAKGGPLAALLGYRKGAPCDTPNGSRIAKAMAARMAQGSASFAQDWLTANGDNNADNAVAIDHRGYWSIDSGFFGGYDITGPLPIP